MAKSDLIFLAVILQSFGSFVLFFVFHGGGGVEISSFLPSRDHNFDYLEFRLWIGLWSAFLCLILVATDASFLVQYFTRFTEEGFSSLISFIFIYDAFKKMIKLADYYPINSNFKVGYNTQFSCVCVPPNPGEGIMLSVCAHPCLKEAIASMQIFSMVPWFSGKGFLLFSLKNHLAEFNFIAWAYLSHVIQQGSETKSWNGSITSSVLWN